MESILNVFGNLDDTMLKVMHSYGALTYLIIFLVIFLQTGLILAPFLPGDALIFIIGTMCYSGGFNFWISAVVLIVAAIAGDNVNYRTGKALGPRLFKKEDARFFKKENLEKTHAFYERQGSKMMVIAHFIAIVRTFAPFVAGMGRMNYPRFVRSSAIGAVLWIVSFLVAGYFLGKTFENDLEYLIIGILVLTSIPAVVTWIRERKHGKSDKLKSAKTAGAAVTVKED